MNKIKLLLMFAFFFSAPLYSNDLISKSPEGATLYFISPVDGETVNGELKVRFGLSGMGVAPAGANFDKTGHHHILIDTDISSIDLTKPLPANDNIKHFGGGQTETTLKLPKGKHTLQLLLGNYVHIPHDIPVVSEKITVIVK